MIRTKNNSKSLKEQTRADNYLNIAEVMIIVLDTNGKVTLINRKGCEVLGYQEEEVLGKNWMDNFIPGPSKKDVKRIFNRIRSGDLIKFHENPVLTRNNEERIISWHNSLLEDDEGKVTGVLCSGEDITKRKLSEEALQVERAHIEEIFMNAFEGFVLCDQNGRVKRVNRQFLKMFGYSEDETIGKSLDPLISPNGYLKESKEITNKVKEGKNVSLETIRRHKNGTLLNVSINASAIIVNNEVISIFGIYRDITAQKQAESDLKNSEERLKILFDYAPDAIYLNDMKGRLVDGNMAAEKITGYKREELIGKNFIESKLLSPDQYRKAVLLLGKGVLGRATGPDELILNNKNGTSIPVEIRTYPVKIKNQALVLGIARDISDRKKVEEALKESEEKFRNVALTAKDAIIFINEEGKITYWNKASEEIFGHTKNEAMGNEVHEFIASGQYKEPSTRGINQFKKSGMGPVIGKTIELMALKKDGIEFPIEMSVSALNLNGKWNAIGIIRDITERKNAETKLKHYSDNLEAMVRERTKELHKAQEKLIKRERLAVLGQLAGSVGHDLRTPLGAIKNAHYFLNMIFDQPDPETKQMLKIIEHETTIAEGIINGLLNFARPRSSTKKMLDLNEAIKESLLRIKVPQSVTVETQLQEDLHKIFADPIQIGQIIVNVATNAIQAMPEGGQLEIKSQSEDSRGVCVSFKDSGVGISKKNMEKLFEPLFSTKSKGTGLGLALVKTLVEGHGGTIMAESEDGKGSTFTVRFPTERNGIADLKEKIF